jgi:signal transduction histidine kinase
MKTEKLRHSHATLPLHFEGIYNNTWEGNDGTSNHTSPLKIVWPIRRNTSLQATDQETIEAMMAGVQQKERKLIGQELHDNVNQILSTVKLFMEMLEVSDAKARGIRKKTISYVTMAINEIRRISWELAKSKHEESLAAGIQQVIDDIHFSTKLSITFNCSRKIEFLDQEKKTALLRIVQEQLKNILHHSKASLVQITVGLRTGHANLRIKDNGIGFDLKKKRCGIGLSNIHDRAHTQNGMARVRSSIGKGCTLYVRIPIN